MIVSVAFPMAIDGVYDYRIPQIYLGRVRCGMPVKVSLRNRVLWGVVVDLKEHSPYDKLKELLEVKVDGWNSSSEALIKLYRWISEYYHTPLGQVFKPLIKKGIVDKKAKEEISYTLQPYNSNQLTEKQQQAFSLISHITESVKTTELIRLGLSRYMITRFEKMSILKRQTTEVLRETPDNAYRSASIEGELTREQQHCVESVWAERENPVPKPFLLHGITGSGKTLVYIELAKRSLAEGQGVIILVPEISLTPQTISRFANALGEDIAVMHSRMSEGERRDSIELVVSGKRRIIIGVRSTILVPMHNIGLIIVDEEHDGSYKQSSPAPRYHARDVAIMRAKMQKSLIVLGSATPAIESYYNAKIGKYHLLEMKERFGDAALPEVTIVNMNIERFHGNWSPISLKLKDAIERTIKAGKQVILLINRRGYSVSLVCRSCGHVRQCPRCSVNLVYHRSGDIVKCHHCSYTITPDFKCSECGGEEMNYSGTGIQKIEDHLRDLFPGISLLRMDQDTTARKGGHLQIIDAFAKGEAQILLGTQMVAKGLNFPNVDVVGVLQADIGLSIPDFRASERLFQLLTQVAGRAGRKTGDGQVYIQSYSPRESSIVCASKHDYQPFYESEITAREEVQYPPFVRLVRIVVLGKSEELVTALCSQISEFFSPVSMDTLYILGPAPAMMSKIKDEYRYSFLIKGFKIPELHSLLDELEQQLQLKKSKGCRITIDVDPIYMG